VVYLVRFHITGDGQSSIEEYEAQMAEAAAQKEERKAEGGEQITEDNVTYLASAASIEKGAAIYKGNCATCHGQLGEGGAGPNFTDEYWIHGGGIGDIFSTIKYGVPEKGMISWQSQFNPEQIQQVSSYIMTLVGTNPPNQKDRQGELYVPEEDNTDEEAIEEDSENESKEMQEEESTENTEA
jgi:cytochrome c oxidase cbb3-type subunit 3